MRRVGSHVRAATQTQPRGGVMEAFDRVSTWMGSCIATPRLPLPPPPLEPRRLRPPRELPYPMPQAPRHPFSPWSEKARWALDVRHVRYDYRRYAPLVGEPALRFKLRKWTGPVTVPVLTDDDGTTFDDSATIARWADTRGDGPTLFPREHEARVAHFVALSKQRAPRSRTRAVAATHAKRRPGAPRDGTAAVPAPARSARSPPRRVRDQPHATQVRRRRSRARRAWSCAGGGARRAAKRRSSESASGSDPRTLLPTFTTSRTSAMTQVLAFVLRPPPSDSVSAPRVAAFEGRTARRTIRGPGRVARRHLRSHVLVPDRLGRDALTGFILRPKAEGSPSRDSSSPRDSE